MIKTFHINLKNLRMEQLIQLIKLLYLRVNLNQVIYFWLKKFLMMNTTSVCKMTLIPLDILSGFSFKLKILIKIIEFSLTFKIFLSRTHYLILA